jgi:hypothetical protein
MCIGSPKKNLRIKTEKLLKTNNKRLGKSLVSASQKE